MAHHAKIGADYFKSVLSLSSLNFQDAPICARLSAGKRELEKIRALRREMEEITLLVERTFVHQNYSPNFSDAAKKRR